MLFKGVELKFYAVGRRRRMSTFVDKEPNKPIILFFDREGGRWALRPTA